MSVEQLSQLFTRKTSRPTIELVLNAMVLVLDRPALRAEDEYEYEKPLRNWNLTCKDIGNDKQFFLRFSTNVEH
jgi:hypothetical protein